MKSARTIKSLLNKLDTSLLTCFHVFVRRDATSKPLDRPSPGYLRLFRVSKNILFRIISTTMTASRLALIVWSRVLSTYLPICNKMSIKMHCIHLTDIPKASFSVISTPTTVIKNHLDFGCENDRETAHLELYTRCGRPVKKPAQYLNTLWWFCVCVYLFSMPYRIAYYFLFYCMFCCEPYQG